MYQNSAYAIPLKSPKNPLHKGHHLSFHTWRNGPSQGVVQSPLRLRVQGRNSEDRSSVPNSITNSSCVATGNSFSFSKPVSHLVKINRQEKEEAQEAREGQDWATRYPHLSSCWQYLGWQPGLATTTVWAKERVYPKCLVQHGLDRVIPCTLSQELLFVKKHLLFAQPGPRCFLSRTYLISILPLEIWSTWPKSRSWE